MRPASPDDARLAEIAAGDLWPHPIDRRPWPKALAHSDLFSSQLQYGLRPNRAGFGWAMIGSVFVTSQVEANCRLHRRRRTPAGRESLSARRAR